MFDNKLEILAQQGQWYELAVHKKLPEAFMDKYKDSLNWVLLATHQVLSEAFIEKHIYRFLGGHKDIISKTQKLSSQFLAIHGHFINWEQVFIFQNFTEEDIEKYGAVFGWYYHQDICYYSSVNSLAKRKSSEKSSEKSSLIWQKIKENLKLSSNFIVRHYDKWNPSLITQSIEEASEEVIIEWWLSSDEMTKNIAINKFRAKNIETLWPHMTYENKKTWLQFHLATTKIICHEMINHSSYVIIYEIFNRQGLAHGLIEACLFLLEKNKNLSLKTTLKKIIFHKQILSFYLLLKYFIYFEDSTLRNELIFYILKKKMLLGQTLIKAKIL